MHGCRWVWAWLAAGWVVLLLPPTATAQRDDDLRPLVERIARGDDDEAAEATDALLARITGPLEKALAGMETRPPAEQRRLLAAVGRVLANIRLRLYRGTLPPADRKLLDDFARRDARLVEQLFDDDPRRRLAALHRIPLDADSGAGVLVVAKVYDWNAEVADAALDVALLLKDAVVARGLARFVAEAADAVGSGQFGPEDQDTALVLADFCRRAIRVIGEAGARDAGSTIVAALKTFGHPPYRKLFAVGDALPVLGQTGDEQVVDVLLAFLNEREVHAVRVLAPGQALQQTVGDAALLGLARIYGLSPEALGFEVDAASGLAGFTSAEKRAEAVRMFRSWHGRNAGLPPADRTPLATQPAGQEPAP
ncbi:MAG: hypothetical protein PVJ57_20270 [Phycisphaerae bacterium]|jgi:hypothetical protein